MKKSSRKINYIVALGRRKESSARVRLFSGKGENTVNGKSAKEYFSGILSEKLLARPFGVTETSDKFYFSARVVGGGKNGQLEALILAISRALLKVSEEKYKSPLRKANLLTRDGREKQRRMVGTGGKARRKKQSPKR